MNPKFVKLMMMTTSSHDGEALAAMRKANAILAEANVNWAEFLSAVETNKKTADNAFRTPPSKRQKQRTEDDNAFSDVGGGGSSDKYDDAADINALFERAYTRVGHGGFRDFLDSVHQWWEDKQFLTEKQYYAIKRAAER